MSSWADEPSSERPAAIEGAHTGRRIGAHTKSLSKTEALCEVVLIGTLRALLAESKSNSFGQETRLPSKALSSSDRRRSPHPVVVPLRCPSSSSSPASLRAASLRHRGGR